MSMTKIPAVADLEQRRQVLAFEVEHGRPRRRGPGARGGRGAERPAQAPEERQVLADRERAVRASAEAEAARVAQRHEPEAHLAQKRREQLAAARVQEAVGPFRRAVEEYLAVGRSVYPAAAALGTTPNEKRRGKNQLNLYLHASLGDLVDVIAPPIGGPRAARQASRVDLLSGQADAGPRETED